MALKKKTPEADNTPQRVIIRKQTATDWATLLGAASSAHWRILRIEIQIRERLVAGKPASLKAAEAMLKARGLDDIVAEAKDIVDPVERAAAALDIANNEGLCEFHRREGKPGIWFPSNHVKAGFKESWSVIGLRNSVRGSRGAMAEGLFVRGTVENDWIYLGEKPADDIMTAVSHSEGPQGPRSAIKRNEYVWRPKLTFDVAIANAPAVSDKMSDDEFASMLVHFSELGLGANRSQGYGRFDVLSVSELPATSS